MGGWSVEGPGAACPRGGARQPRTFQPPHFPRPIYTRAPSGALKTHPSHACCAAASDRAHHGMTALEAGVERTGRAHALEAAQLYESAVLKRAGGWRPRCSSSRRGRVRHRRWAART